MYSYVVLCVLVATAVASPAERQRRQTNCVDTFNNVANPCTNNPNQQVYFPHPSDMTKFIQCDRYGRMYIIQCPENLEYSVTTSTCRSKAVSVITTASPVVNPGVTSNPNNPCTPTQLALGNIYFAVAGDNTKFIECDMLGHANVLPCASGLVWDESRLSCVFPFSATSGTGTGTGTGTGGTTGSTTGTGSTGTGTGGTGSVTNPCTQENIQANKLFFAHPDPTKFIQCDLWGDMNVLSCPAGLVWNQYSETCASAYIQVNNNVNTGVGK